MLREYEERLSILEGRVVALEDCRAQGASGTGTGMLDERMHHVGSRLNRLEMNSTQYSSGGDAGRLPPNYVSWPAGAQNTQNCSGQGQAAERPAGPLLHGCARCAGRCQRC